MHILDRFLLSFWPLMALLCASMRKCCILSTSLDN
jgi:hypothetical protein